MAEEREPPRVTLEIVSQKGKCPNGHQVGEKFDVSGTTPAGICASAYHSAYPAIYALKFGGQFPWEQEEGTAHTACPDPENPVVMKITRTG
jgi:uncharacterized repeat protein (TIGR04076 family)